uniref:Secreted protein n=1 Tax=Panagrellus redivivus TaxID=6233 RepID=A0A7E4W6U8_PANRE
MYQFTLQFSSKFLLIVVFFKCVLRRYEDLMVKCEYLKQRNKWLNICVVVRKLLLPRKTPQSVLCVADLSDDGLDAAISKLYGMT